MISRREVVMIGTGAVALSGAGNAVASTVVQRRDHHPELARGKVQNLLKMISKRDFDAYFESGLSTEIYQSIGPANNEDDYLKLAMDFTETDGRRDSRLAEVGAIRTICRHKYSASYLCQISRSRYFKESTDDFNGMVEPLKAGFYEVSDSWLATFEADHIACFRELSELQTTDWWSTT